MGEVGEKKGRVRVLVLVRVRGQKGHSLGERQAYGGVEKREHSVSTL